MAPQQETEIHFDLLDGTHHEFTTRTFMCAADRVAWERQFGLKSSAMIRGAAGAERYETTKDLADLADSGLDEEWLMFFAWRCAVRDLDGFTMGWQEFSEQLAEYDLPQEAKAEDPTMAEAASST
jgi:hypothetical protein